MNNEARIDNAARSKASIQTYAIADKACKRHGGKIVLFVRGKKRNGRANRGDMSTYRVARRLPAVLFGSVPSAQRDRRG